MSIFKRKSFWIVLAIIVIIVLIIVFARGRGEKEEEYNTIIVERQDLLQTVSETGKVVSDPDIQLGFQTNGIIGNIFYEIGEKVGKGDVITALEGDDQSASIASARAALQAAQAALNLKLAGATQEEINISKANVEIAQVSLETAQSNYQTAITTAEQNIKNAEVALEKAKINLNIVEEDEQAMSQGIQDAYDNLLISINTSLTTVYNSLETADSVIGFDNKDINDTFEKYLSAKYPQYLVQANNLCPLAQEKYEIAASSQQALSPTPLDSEIDSLVPSVDNALDAADDCLYYTRLTLENSITTFAFTDEMLNSLIANVDAAIASLNNSVSSFETYKQALTSAKNIYEIANQDYLAALQNLETVQIESENQIKAAELAVKAKESALAAAQAELDLLQADPRDVDLAGLYAEINRANANLNAANYSLRKTQIIAPVDGVVSKMEYDVGENISAFTPMTAIITPLPKIDVDISETDIAKVELDDAAEITLDAFGDDIVFPGKVVFIEPAETEIAGVIYYKVKIVFESTLDKDIKPGMTANVDITTDKRENVLAVPHRAILSKDGKKIVRVLKWGEIKEVDVTIGLRGDSNTEITSGLEEGDEVVTFIKSE